MKVLIVEDEAKTAELLQELIEGQPGFVVLSTQDSIEGTVAYLRRHQENIDVIFLDVQLADGRSFDIFNRVQVHVPVVFCTAYDEYLLQAFKSNGVDYILKPFEDKDIFNALEKIRALKRSLEKDSVSSIERIRSLIQERKGVQRSIIAHVGERMVPIEVETIAVFHLDNEVVRIYCSNNQKYIISRTMDELQSVLDERLFFRINRQMIINRKAIRELEQYFNRKVIVKMTVAVPEKMIVSRLKVPPFLKWLEDPA